MAYVVMAYVVMAYPVVAYVVMAYVVMAYVVMAGSGLGRDTSLGPFAFVHGSLGVRRRHAPKSC